MGQPDLVTDSPHFQVEDIVGDDNDDVDKEKVLAIATKLGEETAQGIKLHVPDDSQQVERIRAAKAHVESLMATTGTKSSSEGDHGGARSSSQGIEGQTIVTDLETVSAHRLLYSRVSDLEQLHTPYVDSTAMEMSWCCRGTTAENNRCVKWANFEDEHYRCT